jgi:3',5'-cyclic AMP phosphodiesterase CpdA
MLIAQITDTHIKPRGRLAYGNVLDSSSCLKNVVKHCNEFNPTIDLVFVTGDLTDSGQLEEYEEFNKILRDLKIPWFVIPGNHDNKQILMNFFDEHEYLPRNEKFCNYVIDKYPFVLIGLDTTVPGENYGELCNERLQWLVLNLKRYSSKPIFLFMHHPPFDIGIDGMDSQNLKNSSKFFEIIRSHPQVKHIACGHAHRATETVIGGIGISIAPNGAHSVHLDLNSKKPPMFIMEPPTIRIFKLNLINENVVSHLSFVGKYDGPYPFYSDDGLLLD